MLVRMELLQHIKVHEILWPDFVMRKWICVKLIGSGYIVMRDS